MKTGRTFNARRWMALGAVALVMLAPAATEACSDCGARTVSVAQEKARESRDLVDAPGTLRMHAPMARFFRTNGAFPTALEHEALGWYTPAEMSTLDFCPADAELLPVVFKSE